MQEFHKKSIIDIEGSKLTGPAVEMYQAQLHLTTYL